MRGGAVVAETIVRPYGMRAKDIQHRSVRNPQGEDLGRIEDVVIDMSTGCIAYAALSFGGFMGLGDKLFAIPPKALTYGPGDDKFILDVPKETLESAEGFDKNNWPDVANREWLLGVYTHYGYTPYWE
jgi:hypothetical protein